MLCKCVVAWGLTVAVCGGLLGPALAEDPKTLAPTLIELKSEPCGDGWTWWDSIGDELVNVSAYPLIQGMPFLSVQVYEYGLAGVFKVTEIRPHPFRLRAYHGTSTGAGGQCRCLWLD